MVGSGVSKSNERNDHLRNDHKSQDGIGTGESNPGCRPRTSKEAVHENVSLDRKLDGADPISGKYFRRYFLLPLTDQFFTDLYRELFILLSDVLLLVPIIYLAVYALKGNDQLSTTIVRFPVDGNVYEVIALCSCLRLERSSFHGIVLFVVDLSKKERYDGIVISVIVNQIFGESALISKEMGYGVFPFHERFFYIKFDKGDIYIYIYETIIFCSIILSTIVHDLFRRSFCRY